MRLRSIWLALVCAAAAAGPARGQRALEVGALFGYYRPLGRFDPSTAVAGLAVTPQNLSGAAVGGEARLWFGPRWGLQLEGATAGSKTPEVITPGGGPFGGAPARVTSLTAQVICNLVKPGAPARLWLGAGPALIRHGGSAYSHVGTPTGPGLSAAAGATLRMSPHVRATAGAGATLYDFKVNDSGGLIQSAVRKDLLLHIGLGWSTR